MENILDIGRTLSISARNILKSEKDLNAILEFLINNIEIIGGWKIHNQEIDFYKVDWIRGSYFKSIVIRSNNGGRPIIGSISFGVWLTGRYENNLKFDWPWLNQACLIIGWHKGNKPSVWSVDNFEPLQDNFSYLPPSSGRIRAWKDGEREDGWFFLIPIGACKSENDLRRHILQPLAEIINNNSGELAFPQDSIAIHGNLK